MSLLETRQINAETLAVAAAFKKAGKEVTVDAICSANPKLDRKRIYNALDYFTRHKKIKRLGYGRYTLIA